MEPDPELLSKLPPLVRASAPGDLRVVDRLLEHAEPDAAGLQPFALLAAALGVAFLVGGILGLTLKRRAR